MSFSRTKAPQSPEERSAYLRQWRLDNPEKVRQYRVDRQASGKRDHRAEYQKNIESNRATRRSYWQTPENKLAMYVRNAQRRGVEFALSLDQFVSFWGKPCSYCGAQIETIGLDRVDSALGYLIENVSSCCKLCNYAKGDMSASDYVALCKKVAARAS